MLVCLHGSRYVGLGHEARPRGWVAGMEGGMAVECGG